jgi:hypothetical protein
MSTEVEENPFTNRLTVEKPAPSVTKEIVPKAPIEIGPDGLVITSYDQLVRIALVVHKSQVYPSFRTEAQIIIGLLRAIELKLPLFQALEGLSVINGRVTIMGDLALAVVERSGLLEDLERKYEGEGETLSCTLTVKRKDRSPRSETYSWKDAVNAGDAGKPVYKKSPRRMLYYRALGFVLRDMFPEILRGMKTTEEVEDYYIKEQAEGGRNYKLNS